MQATGIYNCILYKTMERTFNTGYFDKYYLATDKPVLDFPDEYLIQIPLKKDNGWSNNIINALAYVREPVFFMGCEDHLLVDFDEPLVETAFKLVEIGDYGCIRLTTKPIIKQQSVKRPIDNIDRHYRYYVSCQPAVWNKDFLESILRPGETSWQFELCASQRARKLELPAGVTR
jgi:hypothetical protein